MSGVICRIYILSYLMHSCCFLLLLVLSDFGFDMATSVGIGALDACRIYIAYAFATDGNGV